MFNAAPLNATAINGIPVVAISGISSARILILGQAHGSQAVVGASTASVVLSGGATGLFGVLPVNGTSRGVLGISGSASGTYTFSWAMETRFTVELESRVYDVELDHRVYDVELDERDYEVKQ